MRVCQELTGKRLAEVLNFWSLDDSHDLVRFLYGRTEVPPSNPYARLEVLEEENTALASADEADEELRETLLRKTGELVALRERLEKLSDLINAYEDRSRDFLVTASELLDPA